MPRIKKGRGVHEISEDLPMLSLAERAAASIKAELSGDRTRLLGAVGHVRAASTRPARPAPPPVWNFVQVADRTEEAALVLMRIPAGGGPKQFGSVMPTYVYDFHDLIAQAEQGELERLMKVRNRPRVPPTPDAIARMHEALDWPMRYLKSRPRVARAVWVGAYIAARKVPEAYIDDAIEQYFWKPVRRLGGFGYWHYELEECPSRHELFQLRMEGLVAIAHGLARDRVPVS